ILKSMNAVDSEHAKAIVITAEYEQHKQILDCSTNLQMRSFSSLTLDTFIAGLQLRGLSVFKKSACVTSHLLQEKNAVLLFEKNLEHLCVKCGVCEMKRS
ncbi:MAG: hypothetical protein JWM11_2324, partial [Planctomycetaceae bacterium]|nr:hypothetical protein [Planctomycetaceae bacterium]